MVRLSRLGAIVLAAGVLTSGAAPARATDVDDGVIRLASPAPRSEPKADNEAPPSPFAGARRGFDYEAFEARLEALWFQRKALLADGRDDDAARQAQLIRSFCDEEGVNRLEAMAGALLAEAARHADDGHYSKAIAALELAEVFDPGRPETSLALADVYWQSGRGYVRAFSELMRGIGRGFVRQTAGLTLFNQFALVLVVAVIGCLALFSVVAVARHQVAIRHEVEEALAARGLRHWAPGVGWGLILLPFLVWIAAGWAVYYWLVLSFRFMRRGERMAAAGLLVAAACSAPAYQLAVGVYGLSADPVVRTTLASAGGAYAPDKIVELQQLVETHPDDPVYRFLLAGLYQSGRYLEEAYDQYRQVLALDPSVYQAQINIGNILFMTGQHPEAVAAYRRALDLQPDSVLAYYNMHLAQSESFHFEEAEESLDRARAIDAKATREVMEAARVSEGQVKPVEATVSLGSIWQTALAGREGQSTMAAPARLGLASLVPWVLNPISAASLGALLICAVVALFSRRGPPATRCIRCGRAFCHACKSGRQGHEYCSQCLHLFVIGDGLAPETKTRKLYEVERHERRTRNARGLLALVLPGTAQLLRGRATVGCALLVAWLASLIAWQPTLLRPLERLVGFRLRLDLLDGGPVPAHFSLDPATVIALVAAVVVWIVGNVWRLRRREA